MLKRLMLNGSDAQLQIVLSALQEIWSADVSTSKEASREREALISRPVIYYLLNRINEFSEWAQSLVLELVTKSVPSDSRCSSAGLVYGSRNFVTMSFYVKVYERIKAPLLTLEAQNSPCFKSSASLGDAGTYNEPSFVKRLNLEMLTAVANESNTYEIVTESCEYAANVDIPIARESIRALSKIALQQYDVNAIVDRLLQFLEMEKDYVTAEALVLVKNLLRKYPQWSHDCIAVVGSISSKNVQEPKAKSALIWMFGEYSQDMQDAPHDEEHSAEVINLHVRLHLTAVIKCSFKSPPKTQNALGVALAAGIADLNQYCLFPGHIQLNLQHDCKMFMTEPCSTIGIYSIMYL
ncbi:beta-adaptin-like protein A isoform X2 [Gossypium australe]|uniref:Beta-adaptin-like protein A isoform X2 n=1 Tax=Gossypium australe TaxID=47621 RepID=A0A5B6W6S8_9ROSI|nr:beta-adaptin-like protein A isoform X2 [Gossypium australe]